MLPNRRASVLRSASNPDDTNPLLTRLEWRSQNSEVRKKDCSLANYLSTSSDRTIGLILKVVDNFSHLDEGNNSNMLILSQLTEGKEICKASFA